MAYYRTIYDPREDVYISDRSNSHLTAEEYARATQVRAATILPNYSRYPLTRGMYQELNAVYNDVCPPPPQMDENMFPRHDGQIYPQQYNSPIDPAQNQQLSVVPYGIQTNMSQRSYSPEMTGSAGDLRGIGIPSHMQPDVDVGYSGSPRDLTTVANRPDMQWMVTTSNIDMRTVTPPNATVSMAAHSSGLHYNSSMARNQGSVASISHQAPYDRMGGPSTSTDVGTSRPTVARTKSGKPKGTPGRKRKVDDHQLTPEEAAKRHLRRERNKLAAAKCRNRRRELTDRLQGETDLLEDFQGMLTQEIVSLQQEKDHLEFILASHAPICKVLTNKQMNIMGEQSPQEMSCSDNMSMHTDHGSNLLSPINASAELSHISSSMSATHDICNTSDNQQATTVSVIQAGPLSGSTSRNMNDSMFRNQENMGADSMSMMGHVTGRSMQAEDLTTSAHMTSDQHSRRFPSTLPNLDVLDQSTSCEPLNTPVCTLATPSNTSAVFTFPNTPCMTSSSVVSGGISFTDTFNSTASQDFNGSGCIMSTGHFLHPSQGLPPSYNSSQSVITSAMYGSNAQESCSAAHRRSSSSESHHSPDSVQSPKLLSL